MTRSSITVACLRGAHDECPGSSTIVRGTRCVRAPCHCAHHSRAERARMVTQEMPGRSRARKWIAAIRRWIGGAA